MIRVGIACMFVVLFAFGSAVAADTGALVGVITSYESGNKGTDMLVKTSDGKTHDLWFDNMKKPLFAGKQLPWCPEFPCDGWPSQLVLGKTRVRVFVVKEVVDGKSILSPTRIELAH